jgi:hypothetical protein
MSTEGIHYGLAVVQVINLALLLAAILLMAVALRKLGRRLLGEGQRLGGADRAAPVAGATGLSVGGGGQAREPGSFRRSDPQSHGS